MLAESKSVFWEPNAWAGSDFAACSPPVCLSVILSRLQMWRQSAPHRREMAFWSSAEAQLSTYTRRERRKKKKKVSGSSVFVYGNLIACVPSPFIPHFSSSVLSARNLLRNVPHIPCALHFSRHFTRLPFYTLLFFPTDFGLEIRFLLHIPRELNVIGDVFEQIDPFEGLLAHDVFGRYKSSSFVTGVEIKQNSQCQAVLGRWWSC